MLRCAELGLSRDDLDDMSVGMVYDMMTEKANDMENYSYKPAPGSMKSFFGGGGKV